MKLLFTSILFSLFSICLVAQNYSISNVVIDPPSPDTILPNTYVNIAFDYTKSGGDIRIAVRPFDARGNAGMSGYSLKTDDAGSGTGRFIYYNGGDVKSLKFEFVDLDWTPLYDTIIPVDYTIRGFYLNDLQFSPSSPGILGFGDSIKFDFNFEKNYGDVKIRPLAMASDTVIANQITSGAPTYSGDTGSGSGFIRFNDFTTIDKILFQFLDATSGDTLVEIEKNVYFIYTNDTTQKYSISNVVYNPPSGSILKLNDRVNIEFDYTKPYGDVRIYTDPILKEGNYGIAGDGSRLYTANSGTETSYFLSTNEAIIDRIKFTIQSTSGVKLHEHFEDVYFTYTADSTRNYSITNVEFTPSSPSNLNTGDTIHVKFDYTKPFGTVNFFMNPLKQNVVVPGYEVPTLGEFSADSGTVETYIIYDIETSFDQLSIKMNSGPFTRLYEKIVDAAFTFTAVPFSVSGLTLIPASPNSINIRDSIKINFIYKNLNEQAKVVVTPLKNGNEVSGYESSNPKILLNNSDNITAFIRYNDIAEIDQIKLKITSTDETKSSAAVIYETLIDAKYVFKIPTSAGFNVGVQPVIYPNPTENKLNIFVPGNSFEYSIFNTSGKLILNGMVQSNQKQLDISKFERGIYITKITFEGHDFRQKIILE